MLLSGCWATAGSARSQLLPPLGSLLGSRQSVNRGSPPASQRVPSPPTSSPEIRLAWGLAESRRVFDCWGKAFGPDVPSAASTYPQGPVPGHRVGDTSWGVSWGLWLVYTCPLGYHVEGPATPYSLQLTLPPCRHCHHGVRGSRGPEPQLQDHDIPALVGGVQGLQQIRGLHRVPGRPPRRPGQGAA